MRITEYIFSQCSADGDTGKAIEDIADEAAAADADGVDIGDAVEEIVVLGEQDMNDICVDIYIGMFCTRATSSATALISAVPLFSIIFCLINLI